MDSSERRAGRSFFAPTVASKRCDVYNINAEGTFAYFHVAESLVRGGLHA
jgi:hypothetical protein